MQERIIASFIVPFFLSLFPEAYIYTASTNPKMRLAGSLKKKRFTDLLCLLILYQELGDRQSIFVGRERASYICGQMTGKLLQGVTETLTYETMNEGTGRIIKGYLHFFNLFYSIQFLHF